ncbi:phosphoribosyltransferase domain-containing protein [Imhoffiella purpurea]|uniref:Adenine/guanine phosphoribosyltransferase n=1 Tax=Imhoffiella purpurea TaxID=1249627 RepID=W9VCN4_9GAMM|nr:phosphoribosyltransferase domain-containing protein [Imhoffiella purpurea]EXJ13802.1 Adenine/guanine phosphoribosyltransferase [Imhoffiella purpurea]
MTTRHVRLDTGRLAVRVHESAFVLDELCGFAARNNRNRGFLFLSKVLGKHWPARPSQMRRIHRHLAAQLAPAEGPRVFIAMAETATGLGQGVFEAALELEPHTPGLFVHSTRYRVEERRFLEFLEPHCHAPDQYLYLPLRPDHLETFGQARELVLIDDEISTGTTLCNLVEAYRAFNPAIERVQFVCITDFSGADSAARFSDRLGLPVSCLAALHADFDFEPCPPPSAEPPPAAVGDNRREPGQIADGLGRFGIDRPLAVPTEALFHATRDLAPGAPILILGTGEFMHAAFRVGLELEECGFAVSIQSTTRSPILVGADVQRRLIFGDNYGEGIANYLYNVDPADYARILVCHETPRSGLEDLIDALNPNGISGSNCTTYHYPDAPG